MSHFLAIVLVEPMEPEIVEKAHRLMWPYFDANMETEDAKCDGFLIGGRFDGEIWGKEQHYNLTPAEFQIRYGMDVVRDEDNIRNVSELWSGLLPYAVVTPDGRWLDRNGKQESQWKLEWEALLAQFKRSRRRCNRLPLLNEESPNKAMHAELRWFVFYTSLRRSPQPGDRSR